jgi:transcriptional regulator with XRE-family HTH domain
MNANHLRRLRYDAGLSTDELAERADVAKSTIGDIESGKRFPQPGTAKQLADALSGALGRKVSPSEIFFDHSTPSEAAA